jgi:hypothetical protein
MRGETWIRRRGASDLGYVDGTAGEGRNGEAPGEGPVAGESEVFRLGARHFCCRFAFELLIEN